MTIRAGGNGWQRASVAMIMAVLPISTIRAQCADGRPAPCAVRSSAVAPPPAADRGRRFLLLPFRNVSRAADQEWLVEGSTAMLGESLARWQEIHVVADDRLYPALRRHGIAVGTVVEPARVRRLAEETGGWTAVTGDIVASGGRIRLTARAYDVVTNRDVVRATAEVGASDDVRAAFESITTRLLHAAGLDTASANIASTTTRSLDAYRAYLRGMSFINRGQFVQARGALLEAVRLDSMFAQAHFMLVEAALFAEPFSSFDPNGVLVRSFARSLALADRFMPAEREIFLGVAAIFAGRLAAAREVLERLVARDANDIRAIAWLAFLEYMDPVLVTDARGEHRRGSMNTHLRLARRVLELDPARHDAYLPIVGEYLLAAGAFPVVVPALRREGGNLEELLMSAPARVFVPVLGDTVVLVPAESLSFLPAGVLAAARRRALDSASAISSRWLAAGPSEGIAHHVAAEIAVRSGDYERALEQLRVADSLGTEFGALDSRLVRLNILARQGRYDEARRLAAADDFVRKLRADVGVVAFLEEGESSSWGFNLYLMWGELERAGDILDARMEFVKRAVPFAAMAEGIAVTMLAGERVPPVWLVELPLKFRMDVLDSIWTRSPDAAGNPRFERVRTQMAQLASRTATAPGADPALAERARKSVWFKP